MKELFHKVSTRISNAVGSPYSFILALIIIIVWAVTGPVFKYSNTWQLIINTGTTIVTFLMVFLIQNTQNRDSKAMHLKMDELIRTQTGARNAFVDLENMSDDQLAALDRDFQAMHEKHSTRLTETLTKQLDAEKKRRKLSTRNIAEEMRHVSGEMKHMLEEVRDLSTKER